MIQSPSFSGGHSQNFAPSGKSTGVSTTVSASSIGGVVRSERHATHQQFYDRIRKTANMDSTVLITGESGSGKSTIARMIHEQSRRRSAPFVAVNCPSFPRDLMEAELFGYQRTSSEGLVDNFLGAFAKASGGTLFLDEIADMPLDLQPRLLMVLQDNRTQGSMNAVPYDWRLVVATRQDLSEFCQQGKFREDLYHRLNVLQIKVPPLRQRMDELPKFVQNLLRKIAIKQNSSVASFSQKALFKLQNHSWPGNIRELENVLERAATYCQSGVIEESDITIDKTAKPTVEFNQPIESAICGKTLAEIERLAIVATLQYCNGNKAMTARTLGISEKSIYNKMKRLGIKY